MREQRYFPSDLLAGQVAVVTGGGSGLGLAIATAFTAAGADVVVTSRSADRLAAAELTVAEATGRLCASFPCDVRNEEEVGRLRDFVGARFGPTSIVVNNAAANFSMPAERMTARALRTVLEVDLMGTFFVTRQFLPDLKQAHPACVLSIGVAGAERGFPGYSHAGAAKAAIVSLTGSWAREWGPYGIRVNCIAPGPIPTPGVTANMLGRDPAESERAFENLADAVPLGRLGTPEDVAGTAVFLCSDAASWITGVNLTVDGGLGLPAGP